MNDFVEVPDSQTLQDLSDPSDSLSRSVKKGSRDASSWSKETTACVKTSGFKEQRGISKTGQEANQQIPKAVPRELIVKKMKVLSEPMEGKSQLKSETFPLNAISRDIDVAAQNEDKNLLKVKDEITDTQDIPIPQPTASLIQPQVLLKKESDHENTVSDDIIYDESEMQEYFEPVDVPDAIYHGDASFEDSVVTADEDSQDEIVSMTVFQEGERDQSFTEFAHCKLCGHECKTKTGLKQHMMKLHSLYLCKFCEDFFEDFTQLREHMKIHVKSNVQKAYQCKYCWFSFAKASTWEAHEQRHLIEEPFECTTCSKRFKTEAYLFDHMENHEQPTSQTGFECSYCQKKFTLRCRWKKHEEMHLGQKPHVCAVCNKSFAVQSSLIVHQRQHDDPSTWPFVCPDCDARFISKQKLQRHEAQHTGARPFPCAVCGKGFAQETDCKRHEETHSEERPFPCTYCHMWFKRQIHLRTHEKLHRGDMPFECQHCGRRFSTKQAHMQHERTKHTKDLPFKCSMCSKSFALKSILTQHIKKHSAQIFECSICYKKFSVHSALHQHQKMHKTNTVVFCKYCEKILSPPGESAMRGRDILIEVDGDVSDHIQEVVREVVIE